MAAGKRNLSDVKIDDYVPQSILCPHCKGEVDLSTAHYGRAMMGFQTYQKRDVIHTFHNGQVHTIPTVDERWYPVKIHGYFCETCYLTLWNTTWRDKRGWLKHAFESVLPPVSQPKNDDHEASPITKGLYAPHVVKKSHGRKQDFYENPEQNGSSPVIEPAQLPRVERKLQGFKREKRDDLNLKPKRTIVRNGKWKVDPAKYNYQSTDKDGKDGK